MVSSLENQMDVQLLRLVWERAPTLQGDGPDGNGVL